MATEERRNTQDLELPQGTVNYDMTRQMTIIGRGSCGKTSIIRRHFTNEFSEETFATALENVDLNFTAENRVFKLKIWDTSGQEEFSRLRIVTLPMSDYIMVCYSVSDPLSFYEVEDTLIPMIKQKGRENAKIILVATKVDMRTDELISREEGEMLAKRIEASYFFECSALANTGISNIFETLQNDMASALAPPRSSLRRLFMCC